MIFPFSLWVKNFHLQVERLQIYGWEFKNIDQFPQKCVLQSLYSIYLLVSTAVYIEVEAVDVMGGVEDANIPAWYAKNFLVNTCNHIFFFNFSFHYRISNPSIRILHLKCIIIWRNDSSSARRGFFMFFSAPILKITVFHRRYWSLDLPISPLFHPRPPLGPEFSLPRPLDITKAEEWELVLAWFAFIVNLFNRWNASERSRISSLVRIFTLAITYSRDNPPKT